MTVDLRPEHAAIVRAILADHLPADVTVFAYGSRAKARARPYSDLDLALEGAEPIPRATMLDLADAFDESDLPWKVDLIDWATTSEHFRQIIGADRVALIGAGSPA